MIGDFRTLDSMDEGSVLSLGMRRRFLCKRYERSEEGDASKGLRIRRAGGLRISELLGAGLLIRARDYP